MASTTSRCAARAPTRRDATTADRDLPPTFLNEVTHWWDGSQIYGSDWDTQHAAALSDVGGKHAASPTTGSCRSTRRPAPSGPASCATGGSGWRMLHTVFVQEHNAICDRLAEAYPDWDDEALFQTARLVNAGGDGEDPHHRVDAGDPAQREPARRHARQLVRPGDHRSSAASASRCSRTSRSPTASSAGSSATCRASSPTYGLTEEFVSGLPACTRCCPTRVRLVDTGGVEQAPSPARARPVTRHRRR